MQMVASTVMTKITRVENGVTCVTKVERNGRKLLLKYVHSKI